MRRHRVARQVDRLWLGLLLLLGLTACRSSSAQRGQLASTNPLDQVTAAVWLAEAGDTEAIHKLVSLLEDRERTVRMYAILALERLCGETHGYRFYGPEAERARAVRRWREALRAGEVVVVQRTPARNDGEIDEATPQRAADGAAAGTSEPSGDEPVP